MANLYAIPIRRTLFTTTLPQDLKSRPIRRLAASTAAIATTNPSRHQSTATTTTASSSSSSLPSPPQSTLPPPLLPSSPTPKHPQTPLTPSLLSTLPLLNLQSTHPDRTNLYATLHIHARPYLLTLGDRLRLPFRMPHVQPGDVLRLTHASTLGTRDYTLRGAPWVDGRLFEARAVVAGVESEPMRVMEKTKQRNRKVKRVKSKHRYTEVLLTELRVRTLEELEREGIVGDVVKEYGRERSS